LVHDFYVRFIDQKANEAHKVLIGRISTVALMLLAAIFSLYLTNAYQAFQILLQIGAGTGLLFILRWFWWRINAYSEITAMIVSFAMALYFELINDHGLLGYEKMLIGIMITSISWITVTFLTRPTSSKTLKNFYKMIQPHAIGWKPILKELDETEKVYMAENKTSLATEILMMFLGCIMIYAALFGTGYLLYGYLALAGICLFVTISCIFILRKLWLRTI